MNASGPSTKLRVLLVPDFLPWVTGTIARRIARHNRWIEPTICSQMVVRELISRHGKFPGEVDLVHLLVPNESADLIGHFEGRVPCVSTIHHVETARCLELVPRSDAVATASTQWSRYLEGTGVPASKQAFLPYGVDVDDFRPARPADRRKIRSKLGLPADAFVIGFAAKKTSDSSGRKGVDTLEKALAEAARRLPEAACVIIGPGWGELVARQQAAGIRCVHIPFVPDLAGVAEIQRALDVYWITSRIEGGPVPLLEAMASGVCCVATPVGMVLDVVRDGENGFMVPFDDVGAFFERTQRLASDPDLRRRMGESARQSMVDGYQWWQVCRGAHGLYRTAIERFVERPGSRPAPSMPPADPSTPREPPSGIPRAAFSPEVRSWVASREFLLFASALENMGERGAAYRERLRSIVARPFDHVTVRDAVRGLPLAGPRRAIAAAVRVVLGRQRSPDALPSRGGGE